MHAGIGFDSFNYTQFSWLVFLVAGMTRVSSSQECWLRSWIGLCGSARF